MRMAQLRTLLAILYGNAIRPFCYGQWWEDTLKKRPQDSDRRANLEWKRISSYVASYAVRLRRTSLLYGLGSPHVNPYGMWSLTEHAQIALTELATVENVEGMSTKDLERRFAMAILQTIGSGRVIGLPASGRVLPLHPAVAALLPKPVGGLRPSFVSHEGTHDVLPRDCMHCWAHSIRRTSDSDRPRRLAGRTCD